MAPAPTPPKSHRMSYRIGRGEQGVLTFEPYKSAILPLWRFKTPAIARRSAAQIYDKFLEYDAQDDFVGMDMCRKFLQMVRTCDLTLLVVCFTWWVRGGLLYGGAEHLDLRCLALGR